MCEHRCEHCGQKIKEKEKISFISQLVGIIKEYEKQYLKSPNKMEFTEEELGLIYDEETGFVNKLGEYFGAKNNERRIISRNRFINCGGRFLGLPMNKISPTEESMRDRLYRLNPIE